ncbi:MAG: hypothetical protein ACW96X_03900 [Promethearchaeota archaeon]|jgi:hypothetical protein
MTKQIIERKIKDMLFFEFMGLSDSEDAYFISDILESEFKAKFIYIFDSYGFTDLFSRTLKIDETEFDIKNDLYEGLGLSLKRQNEEDNEWLRNLAHEVLNAIKERGSNYLTEKAKARQAESWKNDQIIIDKRLEELEKNRENRNKKK